MSRWPSRTAAAIAVAGAVVACAGCSPAPIDPSLWRQVDHQENVIYGLLSDPQLAPTDPQRFVESLEEVADYWDGTSSPDFISPAVGSTVYYNLLNDDVDEFGDPILRFDVFVTSGHSRQESRASSDWFGWTPSSIYTCYRLSVTFAAESVWDFARTHDSGDDQLVCPDDLVSALGDASQYREPWEFDG